MLRRATLVIFTLLLAQAFSVRPLSPQVKGTIEGQTGRRYPIAISPLKNLGASDNNRRISESVADAIGNDLNLSGWFRVLDRSAFIDDPQQSGITLETINFKNWSTLGAESLVKGGFSVQGDDLTVELRLFDVYQSKQLVGKKYTGKVRDSRRIAHKFADEIINQFTGTPGPFNSRIAYVSKAGGSLKEVYVSHLDGSEKSQITNNRSINLSPAWSPDGRTVLYTSYKDGVRGLFLYDLTTGRETRISDRSGSSIGGKWSPDGQTIAVSFERGGNTDLYLLDRSGKILRRLTEDRGIDVSPSWSPDGNRLAFVSNRSGSPQIYIMDLGSGSVRRLTFSGSYNTSPDWSPKGDKIAYTSRVAGRFQVFTISVQGGEPQQLTSGSGDNEDPSWAPDGRFLAFASNRGGGRYRLYIMRDTGENQATLTASGSDDTNPSWSARLE
ncbi:MAG TPA: Tol-Pal system beta propeller repeat protein TolB [Candidatus Binatia bacterium]|jgi:TolB protein